VAATKTIKINKGMKLLLFKNSFKLNIVGKVVYFPIIRIETLEAESDLFEMLPEMFIAAYKLGKEDATDHIKEKYTEFIDSMD